MCIYVCIYIYIYVLCVLLLIRYLACLDLLLARGVPVDARDSYQTTLFSELFRTLFSESFIFGNFIFIKNLYYVTSTVIFICF